MEDERDLVTFTDEEGNEFDLEVIDYFEHNGKEYAVLVDADLPEDPEEDFEVCIMEIIVNEEEDMEEFVPVDDDLLDVKLGRFLRLRGGRFVRFRAFRFRGGGCLVFLDEFVEVE